MEHILMCGYAGYCGGEGGAISILPDSLSHGMEICFMEFFSKGC